MYPCMPVTCDVEGGERDSVMDFSCCSTDSALTLVYLLSSSTSLTCQRTSTSECVSRASILPELPETQEAETSDAEPEQY